jgi:tellurite resistance protein TehA-like permease
MTFSSMRSSLTRVPPNYFAIPFGLAGLGAVWRLMQRLYGTP